MRAKLAAAAKRALFATGATSRRLAQISFPGVAVLAYHGVRADARVSMPFAGLHVTAAELAAHCRLVAETCQPISLETWFAAEAGGPPLPPRPVLLTFDDGYRSVLELGLPILIRYQVPAVVFAVSQVSAQGRLTWYDALARARGEAAVDAVKSADADRWRAAVAAAPEASLDDPCALLSPSEIRRLAASDQVEIGGHTAHHPILARLTAGEQRDEIASDRQALQTWTTTAVRAFAYPNGRPGIDYDADSVAAVAQAGYRIAFTTRYAFSRADEPALERSRFVMLSGLGPAELAHRLLRFAEAA
ncbi:MAG: polysaccharide deacetylase family protein [Thermoanaerobaculia bacterium]|nr:polysaccharide deacetylase family protein [Thermoanaerobaculia bacterium]